MKSLAPLTELRELWLSGEAVTDPGLGESAGLKSLEILLLGGVPKITDVGLKSLAGLTELRLLELDELPGLPTMG